MCDLDDYASISSLWFNEDGPFVAPGKSVFRVKAQTSTASTGPANEATIYQVQV